MHQLWKQVAQRFLTEPLQPHNFQKVQTGFSGAGVVRVTTKNSSYAIRRWPTESLPSRRILELHRFLAFLSSHSLPVAVPLRSLQDDRTLISVGNSRWQMEPWLAGDSKCGDQISDAECQSMMQTLAKIHIVSQKYTPSNFGKEWFATREGNVPAIEERLSLIQGWTAQRLQRCQRSLLRAPDEFRSLEESILIQFQLQMRDVEFQLRQSSRYRCILFPCLRDLWSDHVLFSEGNVSGVIDPTATRCDHPGTDLSRLLGSMFENDRQRWGEAITHYRHVRELSSVDLELIHVLDRSSVLLSGMTWIDRWEKQTLDAKQFPAIIERLKVIQRRMQT